MLVLVSMLWLLTATVSLFTSFPFSFFISSRKQIIRVKARQRNANLYVWEWMCGWVACVSTSSLWEADWLVWATGSLSGSRLCCCPWEIAVHGDLQWSTALTTYKLLFCHLAGVAFSVIWEKNMCGWHQILNEWMNLDFWPSNLGSVKLFGTVVVGETPCTNSSHTQPTSSNRTVWQQLPKRTVTTAP